MMYVDPLTGEEEEEISWGEGQGGTENADSLNELLGFDLEGLESEDRSGLNALIGAPLIAHRRLPALEVIFERASRLMSKTLRHHAGDALDISLETVSSMRFQDFLEAEAGRALFAPVRTEGLDGYSLLTVDTNFTFAIVDYLLGGHRAVGGSDGEPHAFTSIELALVRRIIADLCDDISSSFSSIVSQPFILDRVETSARFAAITAPAAACILAKFRVDLGQSTGAMRMIIPYACLEPIQAQLLNEYAQENITHRNRWRRALINEISTTNFDLSLVLAEKQVTLGDIARLSVGDLMTFDVPLGSPVEVRIGERKLALGSLGRHGERIAVRLSDHIRQDAADNLPLPERSS